MNKKLYCSECNKMVIEIEKGKFKHYLYIKCVDCQEKDKIDTNKIPPGFEEIFGNFQK